VVGIRVGTAGEAQADRIIAPNNRALIKYEVFLKAAVTVMFLIPLDVIGCKIPD
jgi:hypothetical protein